MASSVAAAAGCIGRPRGFLLTRPVVTPATGGVRGGTPRGVTGARGAAHSRTRTRTRTAASVPTLRVNVRGLRRRGNPRRGAAAASAELSGGDDASRSSPRIGFIGAGAMAEAMARGFVKGGVTSFDRVTASNAGNQTRAALWRELGADVRAANDEVLAKSDVVFLAVKPHVLPGVLAEVCRPAGGGAEDRHLFVSVAAGVSTGFIERAITEAGGPSSPRVVRVMPNTPCLVGAAASAACAGTYAADGDLHLVSKLMASAGTCITVGNVSHTPKLEECVTRAALECLECCLH